MDFWTSSQLNIEQNYFNPLSSSTSNLSPAFQHLSNPTSANLQSFENQQATFPHPHFPQPDHRHKSKMLTARAYKRVQEAMEEPTQLSPQSGQPRKQARFDYASTLSRSKPSQLPNSTPRPSSSRLPTMSRLSNNEHYRRQRLQSSMPSRPGQSAALPRLTTAAKQRIPKNPYYKQNRQTWRWLTDPEKFNRGTNAADLIHYDFDFPVSGVYPQSFSPDMGTAVPQAVGTSFGSGALTSNNLNVAANTMSQSQANMSIQPPQSAFTMNVPGPSFRMQPMSNDASIPTQGYDYLNQPTSSATYAPQDQSHTHNGPDNNQIFTQAPPALSQNYFPIIPLPDTATNTDNDGNHAQLAADHTAATLTAYNASTPNRPHPPPLPLPAISNFNLPGLFDPLPPALFDPLPPAPTYDPEHVPDALDKEANMFFLNNFNNPQHIYHQPPPSSTLSTANATIAPSCITVRTEDLSDGGSTPETVVAFSPKTLPSTANSTATTATATPSSSTQQQTNTALSTPTPTPTLDNDTNTLPDWTAFDLDTELLDTNYDFDADMQFVGQFDDVNQNQNI